MISSVAVAAMVTTTTMRKMTETSRISLQAGRNRAWPCKTQETRRTISIGSCGGPEITCLDREEKTNRRVEASLVEESRWAVKTQRAGSSKTQTRRRHPHVFAGPFISGEMDSPSTTDRFAIRGKPRTSAYWP